MIFFDLLKLSFIQMDDLKPVQHSRKNICLVYNVLYLWVYFINSLINMQFFELS